MPPKANGVNLAISLGKKGVKLNPASEETKSITAIP